MCITNQMPAPQISIGYKVVAFNPDTKKYITIWEHNTDKEFGLETVECDSYDGFCFFHSFNEAKEYFFRYVHYVNKCKGEIKIVKICPEDIKIGIADSSLDHFDFNVNPYMFTCKRFSIIAPISFDM
jgi:hypothetical protein